MKKILLILISLSIYLNGDEIKLYNVHLKETFNLDFKNKNKIYLNDTPPAKAGGFLR